MASFEEHCQDCQRLLGNRCEDVNRWIDGLWWKLGPMHRCGRHHTRGVREASDLFGELGSKAALVHILKDCGHIPTTRQWKSSQEIDTLGMLVNRPFNGFWDPLQFERAAKRLLEDAMSLRDAYRAEQ
jgi:hypothetical protein